MCINSPKTRYLFNYRNRVDNPEQIDEFYSRFIYSFIVFCITNNTSVTDNFAFVKVYKAISVMKKEKFKVLLLSEKSSFDKAGKVPDHGTYHSQSFDGVTQLQTFLLHSWNSQESLLYQQELQ